MNVTKKDRQRLARLIKSLRAGIPLVGFLSAQAATTDDTTKDAWCAVSNAIGEVRLPVATAGVPAPERIDLLRTPVVMGRPPRVVREPISLMRPVGVCARVDPTVAEVTRRVRARMQGLVQKQELDGSWSAGNVRDTAYVVLAIQAVGSSSDRESELRGLAFLLRALDENRIPVEDEVMLAYVLSEACNSSPNCELEDPICRILTSLTAKGRVKYTPYEAVWALAAVRALRAAPIVLTDDRFGGLIERVMASVRAVDFGSTDEGLACRCFVRMVDGDLASEEVASDLAQMRGWLPDEHEGRTELVVGLCKHLMRISPVVKAEDRESALRWEESQRKRFPEFADGLTIQEQCLEILRATIQWQGLKCASRAILSPTSRNAGLKQLPLPEIEVDI